MRTPRSEPDQELLAFQEAVAGRYSVQRELGRGGMGVVYLAREVRLDRPVALKVLPRGKALDPGLRERFLGEARTAARLSHPHIVPVHAVDEAGDFVFFAMAFIAGETLGERIRSRGPLPPGKAARVLREVAWALAYAHAQGVIHRDVKPDNILLEEGTGRALVTDFGIAGAAWSSPGRAVTAEAVGTAGFASPEQAAGEPPDRRSDLYSLGVVGYYALSGRMPARRDAEEATRGGLLPDRAPAVQSVAKGTPAALARAVDRCLAREPESRFDSCDVFAEEIGPVVEGRRAVPAPIRLFLEEAQAQPVGMVAASMWGVGVTIAASTGAMVDTGAPATVLAAMGAVGAGVAATPLGILAHKARRLLRAGHDHDEVVRVLRDEVEERKRALATAATGDDGWLDRWSRRITFAGLGTYVTGLTWLGWGPYIDSPLFWSAFWTALPAAGTAFVAGGLVSVVRGDRRGKVRGSRWLRFWDSLLGRGIFRAAGLGVDRTEAVDPGYRPTAVAIGMAADRLFRQLPPALRKRLQEVPDVLRALEADADRMRARIAALEESIAETGATEPLREARSAAEERLAEVVAALETIRLHLIRMQTGAGSADQLTGDLGAARALVHDMERLAGASREVDHLLGAARTRDGAGEAPTPAPTPTPTPV